MSKSYADIIKQIEDLKAEAERIKNAEIDGVVARIKEAITAYGLSASDLGLRGKPGPKPGGRRGGKPGPKPGAKSGRKPGRPAGSGNKPGPKPGVAKSDTPFAKPKGTAKFRDADGNVWVGRGPRPQWLRDALARGRSLQDFAV